METTLSIIAPLAGLFGAILVVFSFLKTRKSNSQIQLTVGIVGICFIFLFAIWAIWREASYAQKPQHNSPRELELPDVANIYEHKNKLK